MSYHGTNIHYSVVRKFNRTNLNDENADGDTPLHIACDHGHYDLVDYLMESNSDVNHM